jgi:hypothetical protein
LAGPRSPSRTFSARSATRALSPALSGCGVQASMQPAAPRSMVARSPLRDSTLPSSTLEAPVKLATKESAGRL